MKGTCIIPKHGVPPPSCSRQTPSGGRRRTHIRFQREAPADDTLAARFPREDFGTILFCSYTRTLHAFLSGWNAKRDQISRGNKRINSICVDNRSRAPGVDTWGGPMKLPTLLPEVLPPALIVDGLDRAENSAVRD